MKDIINKFQIKYNNSSWVEKFIAINIVMFLATYIVGVFGKLIDGSDHILYNWLAIHPNLNILLKTPWTLITYGFLHADFFHLLFNLIALYYFGNLFLDYFIPKKLINFYVFGTLWGGILFVISYHLFPILKTNNNILVGASSAVSAIIIGLATYMPNYQLKFRFIGFVKLQYIAFIVLGWDIINLAGPNTGGHIAHLGAAIYGFFSIYYRNSFKFENVFKWKPKKKSPLKTAYKNTNKNTSKTQTNQAKIDIILDKISQSGYESLTQQEKEFLFKQKK